MVIAMRRIFELNITYVKTHNKYFIVFKNLKIWKEGGGEVCGDVKLKNYRNMFTTLYFSPDLVNGINYKDSELNKHLL